MDSDKTVTLDRKNITKYILKHGKDAFQVLGNIAFETLGIETREDAKVFTFIINGKEEADTQNVVFTSKTKKYIGTCSIVHIIHYFAKTQTFAYSGWVLKKEIMARKKIKVRTDDPLVIEIEEKMPDFVPHIANSFDQYALSKTVREKFLKIYDKVPQLQTLEMDICEKLLQLRKYLLDNTSTLHDNTTRNFCLDDLRKNDPTYIHFMTNYEKLRTYAFELCNIAKPIVEKKYTLEDPLYGQFMEKTIIELDHVSHWLFGTAFINQIKDRAVVFGYVTKERGLLMTKLRAMTFQKESKQLMSILEQRQDNFRNRIEKEILPQVRDALINAYGHDCKCTKIDEIVDQYDVDFINEKYGKHLPLRFFTLPFQIVSFAVGKRLYLIKKGRVYLDFLDLVIFLLFPEVYTKTFLKKESSYTFSRLLEKEEGYYLNEKASDLAPVIGFAKDLANTIHMPVKNKGQKIFDIEECVGKNAPLCIDLIYDKMIRSGHLKNRERVFFTGYFRDLQFDQYGVEEWISRKVGAQNFKEHFKKGVAARTEEKMKEGCTRGCGVYFKWLPKPDGDEAGCPFAVRTSENLALILERKGIDKQKIDSIINQKKNGNFSIACSLYGNMDTGKKFSSPIDYCNQKVFEPYSASTKEAKTS